jgi:succinate dehydrogenase / fumarate reductase flavoprotein subunit
MEDYVGLARDEVGLKTAIEQIREIRAEFWENIKVAGPANRYRLNLQKAGRLIDFLDLGELMAIDALNRKESCGGHATGTGHVKGNGQLRLWQLQQPSGV